MNSLTSESIPYTCAVLNETLRLLSPIGANVRKWTIFNNHIKIFLLQGNLKLKCHLNRVATLPKNTELEISGIKMKNGFNVEIPYDLLHVHPGTEPEVTLLPEIFIF